MTSPILIVLIILASGLVTTGCSSLQRSDASGYQDNRINTKALDFYTERRVYDEQLAREELGWANDRQLNEIEYSKLSQRLRLKKLESRLQSRRAKTQYYRLKSSLPNDNARIYFLSLPTIEARERWARNRGIIGLDEPHSTSVTRMIEKQDIRVGMTQKAVLESWGDPDAKEVAGNPTYGNERWRYSRFISSNDGYNRQTRVVYFEAGRVAGWETH